MSKVTHLAGSALNRSGDRLSVELHQPADSPSFVMVVWSAKPSITQPTPKALPALKPTGWQVKDLLRGLPRLVRVPWRGGVSADRCA